MKINTRPFAITIVGATSALLLTLYLYQGVGTVAFILGSAACYALLGYIVGANWPVNAWQIGIFASLPCWLFVAWRVATSKDPYNIHIDLSLFIWLPIISLGSAYIGTYAARWGAVRRKKQASSGE